MTPDIENPVVEKHKAILGALYNQADALTKKVLAAYNPTVKYNVNLQNVKRFNGEHIEAAATFLGFKVRADNKKLYKNLNQLSDRVILKIESLFESTCLDCGETYCNSLTENPPLTCHLCLQGSHNCDKVKEKIKPTPRPSGLVWLCFDCYKKNDLSLMHINVASAQIDREDVVEEEENDEDEDDRVSPRRNREKGPSSTITEGSVCEAYKKRECPHGLTGKRLINGRACPNLHPRRCFRWCKHGENQRIGCTKGKDCPYFHPKLCRNSVLKRFCPNKECKFHHLKHTRRPREVLINRNQDNNPKPEPAKAEKLPPGPNSRLRYDSTSTLNASPYPPTVRGRNEAIGKTQNPKTNQPTRSEADRPDSFLVQFLENMKEGIFCHMSDKLAEFQSMIPELVKEQLQTTRPSPPTLPMFSIPQAHQQLFQPMAATQPTQSAPLLNHFQACSY